VIVTAHWSKHSERTGQKNIEITVLNRKQYELKQLSLEWSRNLTIEALHVQ